LKRFLTVFLGILVCGSLLGGQVAKPKLNLNKLKGTLKSVKDKRATLSRKLTETRKQVRAVKGDIQSLDTKIVDLSDKLVSTTNRLQKTVVVQKQVQESLEEATKRVAATKAQVQNRLRWMYIHGESSMADVLLASKSIGEFASRGFLLQEIAHADRDLFERHADNQRQVAIRKKRVDSIVREVADLRGRQTQQKIGLTDTRNDKASVLGQLRNKQADLERLVRQLDQEEASIQARIQAYYRSLGGKAPLPKFTGRMGRPTAGRVNSGFGMRFHPILHRNRMHTGVDFAGGHGAAIVAAADGIVIAATYGNGYGKMVMVDHGGGVSTLYGHCSSFLVGSGQRVKRGQRIASVGATGLATGPHLHFEVRVNGKPQNPMKWL
jgi:murein DD-endopeptidase MepM/ murein hydrolase activator NlpD